VLSLSGNTKTEKGIVFVFKSLQSFWEISLMSKKKILSHTRHNQMFSGIATEVGERVGA
jgi:hypothetical protein